MLNSGGNDTGERDRKQRREKKTKFTIIEEGVEKRGGLPEN